jgi:hypothetical protein
MQISMQSHVEMKVRFGGGVGPGGGSGIREGDSAETRFLVGGTSG